MASVQTNCTDDVRYERKASANGKALFNLDAAHHQVIGSSQLYGSTAARDAGIDSVKANGVSVTINVPGFRCELRAT